jgi:hypothetical protein
MYQILKKNGLERRLSLETPQMNMKMAKVTAAVFNAKKNILGRSQRMDGWIRCWSCEEWTHEKVHCLA